MPSPEEVNPTPASTTGGGLPQEYIDLIAGLSEGSTEAQLAMAEMGVEGMLEKERMAQQFIREGAAGAEETYGPWRGGGQMWMDRLKGAIDRGAPKYEWNRTFEYPEFNREFSYPDWEWNKKFSYKDYEASKPFQYQTLGQFMGGRLGPENLQNSPYYGLYQWQNQQQQDAIAKLQRARGGFSSGAGMKEALAKSTGMEQQFAADEYARAMQEYGVDYNKAFKEYMLGEDQRLQQYQMGYGKALQEYGMERGESLEDYQLRRAAEQQEYDYALQKHQLGFSEAAAKYGMSYDEYMKGLGYNYGSYQDELNRYQNLGNYAWLADVGIANARFGAGTQMGNAAMQSGQAIAGLYGQAGAGANAAGMNAVNTAAGLYNSQQNRALQQSALNQAQGNWNYATGQNQILGLANLASGVGTNLYNAYRYNQGGNTSPAGSGVNATPSTPYTYTYSGSPYYTDYGLNAPYAGAAY